MDSRTKGKAAETFEIYKVQDLIKQCLHDPSYMGHGHAQHRLRKR